MNADAPMSITIPVERSPLNISGEREAMRKPRRIKARRRMMRSAPPIKPNSSAATAKIESPIGSGRYENFCTLCPNPFPLNSPEPMAMSDCLICHPAPCGSAAGFIKVITRSLMYGREKTSAPRPTSAMRPIIRRCRALPPAAANIATRAKRRTRKVSASGWRRRRNPATPTSARNGSSPREKVRMPPGTAEKNEAA